MKRRDRGLLRRAGVLVAAAITALATAAVAVPAAAAPSPAVPVTSTASPTPTPTPTAGTCPYTNTLCLFDQYNYGGARFNVRAWDPAVGACVDLVEHGWGGGRAKSAINTNPRSATFFPNDDCTGRGWPIEGYMPSFTVFAANSVFVW